MRKKVRVFMFVLCGLLSGMAFSGCAGMELLEDIPRDFALKQETDVSEEISGARSEAGAETVLALAAMDRISFLMEEAYHFAGDSLNETERIWYRDMEQILGGFRTDVELDLKGLEAGLGEEDIDKIFRCVMCDHPELFYVDGYSYTKYIRDEQITSITFSGTYNVDLETAVEREQEIRAAAEEIMAGIGEGAGDYEKVKYVYDTLISNTDYDINALDNQNIYSVFVHHLSVCQGYAEATQYLLNRMGVECTLVQGTVQTGEGHAWNLVKVDGDYYYVDTTWGDVSYRMEDAFPEEGSPDSHEGMFPEDRDMAPENVGTEPHGDMLPEDVGTEAYGDIFPEDDGTGIHGDMLPEGGGAPAHEDVSAADGNTGSHEDVLPGAEGVGSPEGEGVSEEEMRRYKAWKDMPEINYDYLNVTTQDILRTHTIGGVVPMPVCTAVEANYYRREGALFTCYDRDQMAALFRKAIQEGKHDVTVKCQDAACYEEIYEALITGREIFSYLKEGENTVAYAQNENQFSMTFWVTNE